MRRGFFLLLFVVCMFTPSHALGAPAPLLTGKVPDVIVGRVDNADKLATGGKATMHPGSSIQYYFPKIVNISRVYNYISVGAEAQFLDEHGALIGSTKKTDAYWFDFPVNAVKSVKVVNTTAGQLTIYAFNVSGEEIVDTTAPGEVTNIQSRPLSTTSISMTWTNPTDLDLQTVEIWRNGQMIASLDPTTTSFTDTGLSADTTYTYTFYTIDKDGNKSDGITFAAATLPPDTKPPAEISNVKTTVYNDRLKFTWTNPPDTDFMEVRIYKGTTLVAVATTPATQFTDYDLEEHTTYTYLFRSVDTSGNASQGVRITETTQGKPLKPSSVNAKSGNGNIRIEAAASKYATSYNVYVNGQKVGSYVTLPYKIEGLTNEQTYSVQVSGVNQWGESPLADAITLEPTELAPENVDILLGEVTHESVELLFGATNASVIEVYRDGVKIGDLPGDATSYTDNSVTMGTAYEYWIVAENAKGREASRIIKATTKSLGKISLRVAEKKTDRLVYKWDPDPLAEKYLVEITIKRKLTASAGLGEYAADPPVETKQIETTDTQTEVTGLWPGDEVSVSVSGYSSTYGKYGTSTLTTIVPVFNNDHSGEVPKAADVIGSSFSLASNFWFLFLVGAAIILTPWLLATARAALGKRRQATGEQPSARRVDREKRREIRMGLRGE